MHKNVCLYLIVIRKDFLSKFLKLYGKFVKNVI